VHINSGIPNRAFALAARAIGGNSWERPGQVWYAAMTDGSVTPSTDFAGFAQATVDAAARLFGEDATVAAQVTQAWQQVGLLTGSPTALAAPAPAATAGASAGRAQGVPSLPGEEDDDDVVAVRRTGGFTGAPRFAEMSLRHDPAAPS